MPRPPQTYYNGNGSLYKFVTANQYWNDIDPTNPSWELVAGGSGGGSGLPSNDANLVHKTGDETIGGTKNFTSPVGLGTTTPETRLSVYDQTTASTARIANFFAPNASGTSVMIGRNAATQENAAFGFDTQGAYMCVFGRPASDLQVTENGFVNVGVQLTVNGNTFIGNGSDGSGLKVMKSDGSGQYLRVFDVTNALNTNSINFGAVGGGGDLRAHGQNHRWFNPGGNQQLMVLEGNGLLTLTYGVKFPDGTIQTSAPSGYADKRKVVDWSLETDSTTAHVRFEPGYAYLLKQGTSLNYQTALDTKNTVTLTDGDVCGVRVLPGSNAITLTLNGVSTFIDTDGSLLSSYTVDPGMWASFRYYDSGSSSTSAWVVSTDAGSTAARRFGMYTPPNSVRTAVTGATYTNGEATGIAGSKPGMRFFDTNYRYEAMLASDGTTITWVRTSKS